VQQTAQRQRAYRVAVQIAEGSPDVVGRHYADSPGNPVRVPVPRCTQRSPDSASGPFSRAVSSDPRGCGRRIRTESRWTVVAILALTNCSWNLLSVLLSSLADRWTGFGKTLWVHDRPQ
jgi:hypothetical protein